MTASPRSRLLPLGLTCSLAALLALAASPAAVAGGTQTHDIDDFGEFDDGEAEGVAIEASGKLTRGYAAEGAELEHSTVFTCLVDGKQAWVGTSDKATIQRVDMRGGKPVLEELVELEGVVVSALARLPGGDLVAAVVPGGKLVRVDKKGEVSDFAELKDVEQIWAIVPHKGKLLVATGPKGELWSVGTNGKGAKVVLDVPEKNILSVLTLGDEVLVGTSPKARLYTLGDELEGTLLKEFKGDELRAMVVSGRHLIAAVNEFEERGISSRQALTKQLNRASLTGDKPEDNNTRRSRADADAALWAVDLGQKRDILRAMDAAWDEWMDKKGQYFIDLEALDDAGSVLVASSEGGKIYRARNRRDVATIADFDERQVTGLCPLQGGEVLATAADGASVYALTQKPAKKARWVSEVLDANQPANYGSFALRGAGKLELRARTGPSKEVDDRWSAWTTIKLGRDQLEWRGSADLPRRRYMQVEVTLASDDAELRELTAFYAPENLPPLLEEISVKVPSFSFSDDEETKASATVEWEIEARDSDDLLYEAWIRPEGGGDDEWVSLTQDGPISKSEIKLDLETLPDGVYEIRVRASDEPDNGAGAAAFDELVSEPFLIDRTRPTLENVKVAGAKVTGVAKDQGSYVHDVGFSIDGGGFRAASPSDGLFDSSSEGFELRLPADLAPGAHRLVVRARDARGNLRTVALKVGG